MMCEACRTRFFNSKQEVIDFLKTNESLTSFEKRVGTFSVVGVEPFCENEHGALIIKSKNDGSKTLVVVFSINPTRWGYFNPTDKQMKYLSALPFAYNLVEKNNREIESNNKINLSGFA